MAIPALLSALGLALGALAAPQRQADPAGLVVAYRIEARVEDDKRLYGTETVRWTNTTRVRTDELWFHLYLNAFADDRSTHMLESKRALATLEKTGGWGWQRVTSIQVGDQELLPKMRYRAPDDGNLEDKTVASVELPSAVLPGETVEVRIAWESQLPRCVRRTGYKGDFIFAAQWFPKLGVFQGDKGWNCHQFHASTEFFADYGTYDVVLDLPERYEGKVFGSGVVQTPSEKRGDRVITTILAPSPADRQRVDTTGRAPLVHDFAWTADPAYKVRRGVFHYDEWAKRFQDEVLFAGKSFGADANASLRDVAITLLIHPEHEEQWERHIEAASAALFFYGMWFGEYPYEHVTVVDPAYGASAGGMEYPTLFTAGARLFATPDMHSPESVTVHECGHQFWYGLVGNNEFESSWMDEGFNTFTQGETMIRAFGESRDKTSYSGLFVDGVPTLPAPGGTTLADALCARSLQLGSTRWQPLRSSGLIDWWRDQPALTFTSQTEDPRWGQRVRFLSGPDIDRIDTDAWKYADGLSYRINSYNRPALVLRSLPAAIQNEHPDVQGHEAFLRGMRRYALEWRYRHPTPDDFFGSFNTGSGTDMSWYFQQMFRSTSTVDWRISVDVSEERAPRGMFQADPTADFVARNASGGGGDKTWINEVTVERTGELILPVPVRLHFDDGSIENVLWTRAEQMQSAWLKIARTGPHKLVAAAVDPDRGYPVDLDLSNNRWYEATCARTPWRWLERGFARAAMLLWWQGGIGG